MKINKKYTRHYKKSNTQGTKVKTRKIEQYLKELTKSGISLLEGKIIVQRVRARTYQVLIHK